MITDQYTFPIIDSISHSLHLKTLMRYPFFKSILVLSLLVSQFGFSQGNSIDSLYRELKKAKRDTDKILLHIQLAKNFGWNESDSMFSHGLIARNMSEKINYQKGLFQGHSAISMACYITGDYAKGLLEAKAALKIAREQKNLNWEKEMLSRIGLLYQQIENHKDALDYFSTLLSLTDSASNEKGYATTLNNIANCYLKLKQYEKSLQIRKRAIAIRARIDNSNALGDSYNDLGETFIATGKYDSALFYLKKSLELEETATDVEMSAVASMNIGTVYLKTRNFDDAKLYFNKAYSLSAEIGAKNYRLEILKQLAEIAGDENNASLQAQLLNHVLALKDTLYTEESLKQINRLQAEFDTENKELKIKSLQAEQKQQQIIVDEQRKRTVLILVFSAFGIVLLTTFLIIVNNRFHVTKKQKATIEHQKELVDEKQKEILDSINYAKRIQYTLLAHQEVLKKNLPEHFILFQPKDIVSGDFYWATKKDDKFYFAVCDSTGHGVPGAFMSLLNISFLNEAINEKNISSPEKILNYVRERLVNSVSQEGAQDGMDGILLCIDKGKNTISYSSSHNSPVYIRNGELTELPSDKMPIGKGAVENSFSLHHPQLQKGDMLYLFTDGYSDQFGGPKGKKFMHKQLNQLFRSISSLPVDQQKNILSQRLTEWKGNLEQVDDICVVGIRV